MLNRASREYEHREEAVVVAAGVLAVAVPLIVGVMNAPSIRAQERVKPVAQPISTSALPEFEVASIKPSAPDSNLKVDFAAGGKLFITNATLRFLIKIAYDIGDDQLVGGPAMDRIKKIRSGGDAGETAGGRSEEYGAGPDPHISQASPTAPAAPAGRSLSTGASQGVDADADICTGGRETGAERS